MTESEPAVESVEITEPFIKPLIASATLFAIYFLLAWLAINKHWVLSDRNTGLIPFIGISFGLVIIMVFSAIAWPFRRLAEKIPLIGKHIYEWKEPEPEGLLACALCTGMWVGSVLAAIGVTAFPVKGMLDLVIHGLLSAGTSWFLYAITHKLGVYGH